ncbi:P-loop containing nucleoside triphosphate hydrolase protein [Aspergillus egyptiacus]|nr:P-loop containing nucleoside triphosphate hydrolase protein [Aspergillus egyptiacus]
MAQKPIFVATHPRACSTAFERVFMTQRETIHCFHEPFGDPFYYGPERLSDRYEGDEHQHVRSASGYSDATYRTILEEIENQSAEDETKRTLIKDMAYYFFPPHGKAACIAPSLNRIKRGVGTQDVDANTSSGDVGNGNGEGANGHTTNGNTIGANGHTTTTTKANGKGTAPFPYPTPSESGNPTIIPLSILSTFHFAFLIRDPHYSVPSYYRCTIPPLSTLTGFTYYDPSEAGYAEMRRFFDFLRHQGLIGPHVATHEADADEILHANAHKPVRDAQKKAGVEICVVDADEMLNSPAATMEAFCRSVGIPYTPKMLEWDDERLNGHARDAFEKWKGFHEDALDSKGLTARKHPRAPKSEAQFDAEWREKYGDEGAALIRKTVDANMADYLYLKQFAMKV